MSTPKPKPGILDIAPYVAGKSKAAAGKRVIKLSSNESALGPSALAVDAYRKESEKLQRYPDSGHGALREAIGAAHGLNPAQIICGAGSDEVIGLLVHAYAGAGDEVLYSEHGFLMYKIYAQGFGATPVTAPETNLTASVDALLAKVTPRTKIVFLANPNNPTGTYLPAAEVKRLRDGLPAHVILAIDAAYAEYVEEKDYTDGRELVDAGENTIMLRTFSKIYGLPALRLGWGYMPAAMADVLNRIRGPFNVSAPAIAAGIAAVNDRAHVAKSIAHNRQWLAWLSKECLGMGYKPVPSVCNFLLVRFKDAGEASAMNAHLTEQGLIVREVINYGLPDCLRITIGTEEEMRMLVGVMQNISSPWKGGD